MAGATQTRTDNESNESRQSYSLRTNMFMIKCQKKNSKFRSVSLQHNNKKRPPARTSLRVEPLVSLHGCVSAAGAQQLLLVLLHQAVETVAVAPLGLLLRHWAFLEKPPN